MLCVVFKIWSLSVALLVQCSLKCLLSVTISGFYCIMSMKISAVFCEWIYAKVLFTCMSLT